MTRFKGRKASWAHLLPPFAVEKPLLNAGRVQAVRSSWQVVLDGSSDRYDRYKEDCHARNTHPVSAPVFFFDKFYEVCVCELRIS